MAKFLLIEDNEMNAELARFLIEKAGHECVVAPDGIEGLEIAKHQSFDLVLLDIQLPKLDGYEVLKELRKNVSTNIPVVAVSSHAMVGDSEQALNSGFNGYISKPIKAESFVQQVLTLAGIP